MLLPGKRVKVDTDPIALSTDPRQLAALRTALAPLQPPTELLATPLWRLHAAGQRQESALPATAQAEACFPTLSIPAYDVLPRIHFRACRTPVMRSSFSPASSPAPSPPASASCS